jgi:hypothetical protein
MIAMSVIFHNVGDPPLWPAPAGTMLIDAGVLVDVAILDKGMESGLPSVMFQLELPDGTVVIAQQTARQMVMLGRLIAGRYPNLTEEP